MKNRALTLIELILALLLLSGILLAISGSVVFFVTQIKANLEKSDILSQVNYFFEDAKLRSVSAVKLSEYFTGGATNEKDALTFQGEANIYTVTPDVDTDNLWYKYCVNDNSDLVLKQCGNAVAPSATNCPANGCPNNVQDEVLIEHKYLPDVTFRYNTGSSPAVLEVEVTAENKNFTLGSTLETDKTYPYSKITKTAGIRFWFIDIAQ